MKNKHWDVVIIEMDAFEIYEALTKGLSDQSFIGLLIDSCVSLSKELNCIKFNFVRRFTKMAAHILVKSCYS